MPSTLAKHGVNGYSSPHPGSERSRSMKYDAITIDAQTVEHNSFHFDGGLLAQLNQFANGPAEVVISIVVTSSTLSTAGSRRGRRTTVSRRARSGRSSVTVSKKQGRDRAVDARRLHAALRLVQLEAAQMYRASGQ